MEIIHSLALSLCGRFRNLIERSSPILLVSVRVCQPTERTKLFSVPFFSCRAEPESELAANLVLVLILHLNLAS